LDAAKVSNPCPPLEKSGEGNYFFGIDVTQSVPSIPSSRIVRPSQEEGDQEVRESAFENMSCSERLNSGRLMFGVAREGLEPIFNWLHLRRFDLQIATFTNPTPFLPVFPASQSELMRKTVPHHP
jgi:hypothetical protein